MSNVRTRLPIATEPWEVAKAQFLEGLSHEETQRFKDATLENLFYGASVAQKRHAQDNRSWLLQERLASLVDAIDDYGKAFDVYSNTNGLLLSPLWGSLRVIIHIASEAGKFQEKLVDMLAQIGDVLPRFRIYQTLYKSHQRLLVALSEAYLHILRFCVRTKDFFLRSKKSLIPLSIVLKGAWKPFRQDFENYIVKFRKSSKKVEKEAKLAHFLESARIREVELANQALRIRNEKTRIRHKILYSLPAADYLSKHSKFSNIRHPGTNKWFENDPQYVSWKMNRNSDCLCCFGIPGSGKSVLAASVINELAEFLDRGDTVVCYYYCDYADIVTLDPVTLIGSLVKQIIEQLALDKFDSNFETLVDNLRGMLTFSKARDFFTDLLGNFGQVFIVLDGIDEFAQDNQITLLGFLDHLLQQSSTTAKIFTTSRAEEYVIKKYMQPHKFLQLSNKTNDDICHFIEECITTRLTRQNPLLENEDIRKEVIESLATNAKGMFFWVKFQLYDIAEALTEESIRKTLQELPRDLGETYSRIVDRTHRSPGGDAKCEIMQKVFRWIAGARRPLRIDELEEAIGLEKTDTYLHVDRALVKSGERLISACSNLVTYHAVDQTVSFAHHTVQQFLTRASDLHFSVYFNMADVEQDIGDICLAYLSFSDFETQIAKVSQPVTVQPEQVEQMIWGNVPLLSQFRGFMSWKRPWQSNSENLRCKPIQFALPTTDVPSEILSKKYTLLEYVIEFWTFHTAHMSPKSTVWDRFKHIALYRQLSFEFRPWNQRDHQKSLLAELENLEIFRGRGNPSEQLLQAMDSKLRDTQETYNYTNLALYVWAMSHSVVSLLQLIDVEALESYVSWARHHVGSALPRSPSKRQYEDIIILARGPWGVDSIQRWVNTRPEYTLDDFEDSLSFAKFCFNCHLNQDNRLVDKSFNEVILETFRQHDARLASIMAKIYIHTFEQLASILIPLTRAGFSETYVFQALFTCSLADTRSSKAELEIMFASVKWLPTLSHMMQTTPRDRPTIDLRLKRMILAVAVAAKSSMPLIAWILDFPTPRGGAFSQPFFASNYHWSETVFGTETLWNELNRMGSYDILDRVSEMIALSDGFLSWSRNESPRDWAKAMRVGEIENWIDLHQNEFPIEIFERSNIHSLLWAIEKGKDGTARRLFPEYISFIGKDENEVMAEVILRAALASPLERAWNELCKLPWPESVITSVIHITTNSLSPLQQARVSRLHDRESGF